MIEVSTNTTEALEHQVLGRCIMYPAQCLSDALGALTVDDLSSDHSRGALRAIVDLNESESPIDVYGVIHHMVTQQGLTLTDASKWVTSACDAVYTPDGVTHYVKQVALRSKERRFASMSREIARLSASGVPVEDKISEVNQKLIDIMADNEGPTPLSEIIWDTLKKAEEGGIPATRTGLRTYDSLLGGGFLSSTLNVIVARPRVGKSAFAQQIAEGVAERGGGVIFASLEMSKRDVALRAMAAASRASVSQLKCKEGLTALGMDGHAELGKLMQRASEYRFVVSDKPNITVGELKAQARRMRLKGPIDLIVVDYLQLMSGSKSHAVREQEVAEVSRGLKALAKDVDCPVLALAQMNRHVERAERKEYTLADIRESGAIEQDADTISFLHRDAAFDHDADPTTGYISVVKNRHGRGGKIELSFDPVRMRFEEV